MSRMGLSSSISMGTLVLWIQVLVHRCLSLTYEFLQGNKRRVHVCPPRAQLDPAPPLLAGFYLGTNESVFCSVVGSSSNREAISFPWATATNLYLMLSP